MFECLPPSTVYDGSSLSSKQIISATLSREFDIIRDVVSFGDGYRLLECPPSQAPPPLFLRKQYPPPLRDSSGFIGRFDRE